MDLNNIRKIVCIEQKNNKGSGKMKECSLDCALQHEGCCTREDIDCKAKTDDDLEE